MTHLSDWVAGYTDDKHFSKAERFFSTVTELFRRTDLNHFVGPGVHGMLFRGLSSMHPNLPRAFRGDPQAHPFYDFQDLRLPQLPEHAPDDTVAEFLLWHRMCELRAVYRFLNYSDQLGIPTPIDFYEMDNVFRDAIARYDKILRRRHDKAVSGGAQDELHKFSDFPPHALREAFAMAQHYGVPTRLLDLSESLHAAMFFAISSVWSAQLAGTHKMRRRSTAKRGVFLYALGQDLAKRLNLDIVQVTRHRNPRLCAQKGVFILDPKADEFFIGMRRWPSLEDRLGEFTSRLGLHSGGQRSVSFARYSLPMKEAKPLARLLADCGIFFETMHPSLEAAALGWKYRKLITE